MFSGLKKLYHWVLKWGNHRYGVFVLFVLSFLESFIFPLPPDPLLMALCLSKPVKGLYYAFICMLGSVLGGVLGYVIGFWFWEIFQNLFYEYVPGFSVEVFEMIRIKYEAYNFWIVFTGGLTPLPYKVITVTAGVFGVSFLGFLIASVLSRGLRFLLVGWILSKYGVSVKVFIDRYFNILTLLFLIFLMGSYFFYKFL